MLLDILPSKIKEKCDPFLFDGQTCEELIASNKIYVQRVEDVIHRAEDVIHVCNHEEKGVILGIYSDVPITISVEIGGYNVKTVELKKDKFHFLFDESNFILFGKLLCHDVKIISEANTYYKFHYKFHSNINIIMAKTSESYRQSYSFHYNGWTIQKNKIMRDHSEEDEIQPPANIASTSPINLFKSEFTNINSENENEIKLEDNIYEKQFQILHIT